MFYRLIGIHTSHGRYNPVSQDISLETKIWIRITIVYDPASATGDGSENKFYKDNQMYALFRSKTRSHKNGRGQMVLGILYTNVPHFYSNDLIDDLKMWNRKLTEEDIVEMSD